jgi:hypothetical protein
LTSEWPSSARALGCDRLEGIAHPPTAPSLAACCRCVAIWPSIRFAVGLRSPTCRGVFWGPGGRPKRSAGGSETPYPCGLRRRQGGAPSADEPLAVGRCGKRRDGGRQDSRRFGHARVMSQWMKVRMDPQSNGGHHKLSISDGLRVSR